MKSEYILLLQAKQNYLLDAIEIGSGTIGNAATTAFKY